MGCGCSLRSFVAVGAAFAQVSRKVHGVLAIASHIVVTTAASFLRSRAALPLIAASNKKQGHPRRAKLPKKMRM
ncbi:hypothetical protein DL1_04000 [Thioclava dalianensis]|uniref:Uncharacterized protein n=1 Tax=Thioclava dalianensis TaxID=1185766 RepID=A0A074U467_9RHOB|nr:hypothetical protein DL1_04000 [Thioclava dalianensis]SFN03591.1 hypothetical protein SAMN05216224_10264 [Thioclava dalianensis]